MHKYNNINISKICPLPTPADVKKVAPCSKKNQNLIYHSREAVRNILNRSSSQRLFLVVGPCSIHNEQEALDYAKRLKNIAEQVSDKILILMRVYFEKPRTIMGWKGLIYDPDLNGTYNIEKGLQLSRQLMLKILDIGLPVATEMLDPVTAQYFADLVSWAAIGARTTESQPHRQLVSGLSMPVGFKNSTDGSIKVACDAVLTANYSHSFIGVSSEGTMAVFQTKGNHHCHIILRGSSNSVNYSSEKILEAKKILIDNHLSPNIMVDCSHGNSKKDPLKQIDVARDLLQQIRSGENSLIGIMIESYLKTGKQNIVPNKKILPALSITDACLGFDETRDLIFELYTGLKAL